MAVVLDSSVFQQPDLSWVDKRLAQYGKTYFQTAEMWNKIQEQNGKLRLPDSWKEGNEIQDRYQQMLSEGAADFSRGMSSKNQQALMNARNYYASHIVPIEQAVERYNTISDLITKAGGDAIVGNGKDLTLEQIYKNGSVHTPLRTISRSQVVQGASQYFKGLEKLLMKDPSFYKYVGDAEGYLKVTKEGFSSEEVLTMALSNYLNDSNSPESDAVRKYADAYIQGLGVGDFDEEGMSKVRGATVDGIVRSFQQQDRTSLMGERAWERRRAEHNDQVREQNQAFSRYMQVQNYNRNVANDAIRASKTPKLGSSEVMLEDGTVVSLQYNKSADGNTSNLVVKDPVTGRAIPNTDPRYTEAVRLTGVATTIQVREPQGGSGGNGRTRKTDKDKKKQKERLDSITSGQTAGTRIEGQRTVRRGLN